MIPKQQNKVEKKKKVSEKKKKIKPMASLLLVDCSNAIKIITITKKQTNTNIAIGGQLGNLKSFTCFKDGSSSISYSYHHFCKTPDEHLLPQQTYARECLRGQACH